MCSQRNIRKVVPRWPSLLGSHPLGMKTQEQTSRLQALGPEQSTAYKGTGPWPSGAVNDQNLRGCFLKVQSFLRGAQSRGIKEIGYEREEGGAFSFLRIRKKIVDEQSNLWQRPETLQFYKTISDPYFFTQSVAYENSFPLSPFHFPHLLNGK